MKLQHLAAAAALFAITACLAAQSPRRLEPGELPGGYTQLANGWRVKPAGTQIALDTMPMASVATPDSRYLIVLCGGYNPPSLIVLEEGTLKERSRVAVPDGWLGLAINRTGDRVYVGGGSEGAVFEFAFANGALAPARRIDLVEPARRTPEDFVGDVALSPDGARLYAARLFRNGIDVINLRDGKVEDRFGTGRRPYRIVPHPNGEYLYVSSWADGVLYRHRSAKGELVDKLPLAPHPTDMIFVPGRVEREAGEETEAGAAAAPLTFVARLFVTAGNTNSAYVLGVEENGSLALHETINLSLSQWQPVGMTPSALAYDPQKKWLHVVCSDMNAVGVVDVRTARSHLLGFVPVGAYPVAARVLSGDRLLAMNARGSHVRLQGTASIVAGLDAERLISLTREVRKNSPYRDERLFNAGVPAGNPIPNVPGQVSPIKHVIYVLKGQLGYDEVFGDMRQGKGDASLARFGENITPNHHKLAREFVLLDNFYAIADAPEEGLFWASAAIAPDFVRRLGPNREAGRGGGSAFDVGEPAATPPGGYLWTSASLAGVTMRNYGWQSENRPKPLADGTQIARVTDPVLEKVTNRRYRAPDAHSSDADRVKVFLEDLAEFEKAGSMPQLLLMRLGNEGASGAVESRPASELVADNDLALGMLVEAVSKSRFWRETAIVVIEAGAGDGRNPGNGHRSPALVISPFARRGAVDSNFYNTTSALRTVELILGLRPMTLFDAGSFPMWTAFQAEPDPRPYTHATPRTDGARSGAKGLP